MTAVLPGGSGSSVVLPTSVTLTNAQIKSLPTTPVVVVPATETPNYGSTLTRMPIVVGGILQLNNYAVAYSNVDAAAALALGLSSALDIPDWSAGFIGGAIAGGDQAVPILAGRSHAPDPSWPNAMFLVTFSTPLDGSYFDNAIVVHIDNQGAGNLTGGDPTNTLTIHLLYSVIDLA